MTDSLQFVFQDSVFQSLADLSTSVTNIEQDNNLEFWLPFLSALIGGLIAIVVHWIAKIIDEKRDRKKEGIEIQATVYSLFTQLNYQLKNLAYFKHDVGLQYLQQKLATDKDTKAKYYEEHYNSNVRMIESESQIVNILANLSKHITKLLVNKGVRVNYKDKFDLMEKIRFASAKDYEHYEKMPNTKEIFKDIGELEEIYKDRIYNPLLAIAEDNLKKSSKPAAFFPKIDSYLDQY